MLSWLLPRRPALEHLGVSELMPGQDITKAEVILLRSVVPTNNNHEAMLFWFLATCVHAIASWGWDTKGMLHGCPCHPSKNERDSHCPMMGRQVVTLALGAMSRRLCDLQNLAIPQHAFELISSLPHDMQRIVARVKLGFVDAKARMAFRTHLTFNFWSQFPWKLFCIMEPWVRQYTDEAMASNHAVNIVVPLTFAMMVFACWLRSLRNCQL